MADQVEGGDGSFNYRSLEARITRLETDLREVREAVIEIKAILVSTLPTLATKAELAAVAGILPTLATKAELATKAKLVELRSRLPTRTFLVIMIGILIAANFGAAGPVLVLHR